MVSPVTPYASSNSTPAVLAIEPLGLKGFGDPWRKTFTLIWEPVGQQRDVAALSEIVGYNIYRRTSPKGAASKINSTPISLTVFADRVDGLTYYYSVRAADASGNESKESLLVDSSPELNTIFTADDGHSAITIPGNASDILRPAYNKYGVPLTVKLNEETTPAQAGVVRSINIQLHRGDTNEEVSDMAFTSPVIINVGYNTIDGQIALGAPGNRLSQQEAFSSGSPDQLALFWFNGVTWVNVGGTVDTHGQTVSVATSNLGRYQLRLAPKAASLTLRQTNVYPSLFTPNGDGYNDRVYFVLENPNGASVEGKIFEPSGRYVATLSPLSSMGTATTLVWSGMDSGGSVVPSGLYVYRINGENKVLTGTVAVAR